jgi:transcriptional regulator of arginine metabolism
VKEERQAKILELICEEDVETQDDLIQKLELAGFHVTQATVSRDIRELKLVKGASPRGGYRYILPAKQSKSTPDFSSSLTTSIVHVDYARNIVVVKTFPGMANAVAACIDSMHLTEIIGSVAGDDTILAVVRTDEEAEMLWNKIRGMADHH